MPTLMMWLSVKNPRCSFNHPRSGDILSKSSSGWDLTVDNKTIPHSLPMKYVSKYGSNKLLITYNP